MLMKKWLNIHFDGDEFSADEFSADEHEDTENDDTESDFGSSVTSSDTTGNFSSRLSGKDGETARRRPATIRRGQSETFNCQYINIEELRIAVGTWNVAGRAPLPHTELHHWLEMNDPADVYVLGFQEIVPLNAGNVLGSEDNEPALKWQALIRETLNKANQSHFKCYSAPPSPLREETSDVSDILLGDAEVDAEDDSFITLELVPSVLEMESDAQTTVNTSQNLLEVYKNTELIDLKSNIQRVRRSDALCRPSVFDLSCDSHTAGDKGLVRPLSPPISRSFFSFISPVKKRLRYIRVASKQMVGIHISVWVRRKLRRYIRNLAVSCVGLGLMGFMKNKGSISVSMVLHQTSFCFICTHLTSGDKEGDDLRRNAAVIEILKRSHFNSSKDFDTVPKTIWGHDCIIWLGDLNYRLNLSDSEIRSFVAREDWAALLQKDQLRKEFQKGHIFYGWLEGVISFAPTYKYEINTDHYSGKTTKSGERRRAPAWCDRILWHGKGLRQLSYRRQESTLSDHRPVNAVFLAKVEVFSERKYKKTLSFKNSKVDIKELLSH